MRPGRPRPGGAAQVTSLAGPVRRHRPDYQIVLYMGLLMMVGLVVMYAIGPQRAAVLNAAYGAEYGSAYFFIKQATSLGLALAAFIAAAWLPIRFWQRHAAKLLLAGLAACLALMVLGNLLHVSALAQCTLGACRWFALGPLGTFQPAELLKLGILLFLAGFIGVRMVRGQINDVRLTLVPVGIIVAVSLLFVVVVQKDLGTGISIVAMVASMLVMSGLSRRLGMVLLIGVVLAGIMMIVVAPHRMERLTTFLRGDVVDTTGDGYHITHAKIALGTGGLFGLGIGNSVQATGYLPEAINDSVFAIMGETFGFVGAVAILLLFTALLMRLLRVADNLADPRWRLLVAGVFGWVAVHVMLNVAAMLGVFPLTGITLPLLSLGGTSMVFMAAAIGISFQLSRYTVHDTGKKGAKYEATRSRRRIGRPRYASSRSY